jgi:hypothetical protein
MFSAELNASIPGLFAKNVCQRASVIRFSVDYKYAHEVRCQRLEFKVLD